MEKNKTKGITRRDFIKGAAAGQPIGRCQLVKRLPEYCISAGIR